MNVEITALCKELKTSREEIERTEIYLAALKDRRNALKRDLATQLLDLNVTKLVVDGLAVTVNENFYCNIRKDNEVEAFRWFRENGMPMGSFSATMNFDTEEDMLSAIKDSAVEVTKRVLVHWKTLQSVVKKHYISTGELPPRELVNVNVINEAEIS